MKRSTMTFRHEFVNNVPEKMEENVLYISIPFSTAIHLCPCGCGYEVVTKLSPGRWKFTFDGVSVSLYPSIGNWGFPCRSHYWIVESKISWAESWNDYKIPEPKKKYQQFKRWFFKKKRR